MLKQPFTLKYKLLTAAIVMVLGTPVLAGNHPLTNIKKDGFDLVFSVDWDLNDPPKNALGVTVDKAYLEKEFKEFAALTYQMTEGKHTIQNIYIFDKGRFSKTADMTTQNQSGRAAANVGGLKQEGGQIAHFTSMDGQAEDGKTIAHELGHYAYGLFDEYQEEGKAVNKDDPGGPAGTDKARDTVMNNQTQFSRFSVAADYPNQEPTAQSRVYNAAAWDVLVQDPSEDKKLPTAAHIPNRIYFDAFKGMQAPKSASELKQPTTGWENALKVIYVSDNTVRVFILDTGVTEERVRKSVESIVQQVNKAAIGDTISVVTYDNSVNVVVDQKKLTTANERQDIIAQLNNIKSATATEDKTSDALKRAETLFTEVNDQTPGNLLLITDKTQNNLDTTFFNEKCIPVSSIAFESIQAQPASATRSAERVARSRRTGSRFTSEKGGSINPLGKLAEQTEGEFKVIKDPNELSATLEKAANALDGDSIEPLFDGLSPPLEAGKTFSLEVALSDLETQVEFYAEWDEADKEVVLSLKTPSGQEITPDKLPDGVTVEKGDGYISYTVAKPEKGQWQSTVTNAASKKMMGEVYQDISAKTNLTLQVDLFGGTTDDPGAIGVAAYLQSGAAVVGATVMADIYAPEGSLLAGNIVLRDDGKEPDFKANDGEYSAFIEEHLLKATEVGDYEVYVTATAKDGQAKLSTTGLTRQGKDAPDTTLSAFQRTDNDFITIDDLSSTSENTSPEKAFELVVNKSEEFGQIDTIGKKLFYKFTATKDETYEINTYGLTSLTSGVEMKTQVQILDSDGKTVLMDNAPCQETPVASCLQWKATTATTVYIAVENANQGAGSFGIALNTRHTDFPSLGDANAKDKEGKSVAVKSTFIGGISVKGNTYQAATMQLLVDEAKVAGTITIDPAHVGKKADILVYAVHKTTDGQSFWYMLDNKRNILKWDEKAASLSGLQTGVILSTTEAVALYEGKWYYPGSLEIYFGYRLEDGTVVVNSKTIDVNITEK